MPMIEDVTAKEKPMTTPAPRFLPLETMPVRLEGPNVPAKSHVFGVISNMSETGACVITNTSIPKYSDVQLTISGTRSEDLRVTARVVWCAERLEPVKEIVGYSTGLTFDSDTNEAIQGLLSSGVFQLVP